MQSWHDSDIKDPQTRAERLFATVNDIAADQSARYVDYQLFGSLYKDRTVSGFDPQTWRPRTTSDLLSKLLTYNVSRACTDTITNKISVHQPMAKFLTSDGDEEAQEKARKLEQFAFGVATNEKLPLKARLTLRDACIYGMGLIKGRAVAGGVELVKVHPSRIVVDDRMCLDGNPQSLYQREYVTRDQLKAWYPDKVDAIDKASREQGALDVIEVIEGWKLPQGKTPGRHVVAVQGEALVDEEWSDAEFPFAVIRWSHDLVGWFSTGLIEEVAGIQEEINELLQMVQRNMNTLCEPYVLKHESSNVNSDHLLVNEGGREIVWSGGVPPQVVTPPAINPQVFQQIETLYNRAFEIAGVSQLSATSRKPGGLDSGLALMTYLDVETQRFSMLARAWEEFHADVYRLIIRTGRKVKGWAVRARSKDFIQSIAFKDIKLADDMFEIQVYPASSLPQQPAGRLERVIKMTEAGMLPPQEARQLLNFPDLDKWNRLNSAGHDLLERIFETMLKDNRYIPPLEFGQDLQLGIRLASQFWARGQIEGKDQAVLDHLERWMQEAGELLAPPQTPPPPAPMPGPPPAEMPPPDNIPPEPPITDSDPAALPETPPMAQV